jgi:hypothetical protein
VLFVYYVLVFAGILLLSSCYVFWRISIVVAKAISGASESPPPTHTGGNLIAGVLLLAYVCCICKDVLCYVKYLAHGVYTKNINKKPGR